MIPLEEEREPAAVRQVPTLDEPVSKRAMDVILAAAGLLLSAPLWPVIAAAIKLEDGGPVFFSQPRVGKGGELFTGHKFRYDRLYVCKRSLGLDLYLFLTSAWISLRGVWPEMGNPEDRERREG